MVSYGAVNPPDLWDISTVLVDLNRGAVEGLVTLGYLVRPPLGTWTHEQVRQAFDSFIMDLDLLSHSYALAEIDSEVFKVSYTVAEHLLCKFSRMWKRKFYRSAIL